MGKKGRVGGGGGERRKAFCSSEVTKCLPPLSFCHRYRLTFDMKKITKRWGSFRMGMEMRGSGEKVDTFLLRQPYFRLPSEKAQGLPVIENELPSGLSSGKIRKYI